MLGMARGVAQEGAVGVLAKGTTLLKSVTRRDLRTETWLQRLARCSSSSPPGYTLTHFAR
jgi:hypothetical protein